MTIAHTRYLIEKYGSDAVPRYTSYPTALQFRDYQSSQDLSFFWGTVDSRRPVSLYIHIPFCHSLCHYCGCHTKIVSHTSIISAYIDILCREMELVAASLPEKLQISRVHFGGGSPNYAGLDDIEKILLKIRSLFYTTNDIKIDMECDPRLLDREKIKGLAKLGLSRISLGIQDFDPIVQKVINRIQSYEHISRQVIDIRECGIHDINFDIIIGLPEQTLASIQSTASKCIEMRPSRIAVFSYAHVPWMKKHQKLLEKYRFPTTYERHEMQISIRETLTAAGYKAIGIDHYALPHDPLYQAQINGSLRRNFQGYTDDNSGNILGFGLSAISQFDNGYTQNTTDAPLYRQAITSNRLPVAKTYRKTGLDKISWKIITSIMCDFHVDLNSYPDAYRADDRLSQLEADGIIARSGNCINITAAGKPYTRVVASCFDSYYGYNDDRKGQKHAKAL